MDEQKLRAQLMTSQLITFCVGTSMRKPITQYLLIFDVQRKCPGFLNSPSTSRKEIKSCPGESPNYVCLFVCLFGCLYSVVLMLWTWTISFNLTISDIPDIPVSLVAQTVCWNINLFRTVKIEGYWRVTGHSEGWEAPRGERGSERTLRGGGEWKDTRGKRGVRGHSREKRSERTLRGDWGEEETRRRQGDFKGRR